MKRGLLDVDIVGELMSSPIRLYWAKMNPIFLEMRARMNDEEVMEYAEYLYREVEKRHK